MQPAPLTGTATGRACCLTTLARDAARTPHGDGNVIYGRQQSISEDAARTPHGDGNAHDRANGFNQTDAARTPHGDGNLTEQLQP